MGRVIYFTLLLLWLVGISVNARSVNYDEEVPESNDVSCKNKNDFNIFLTLGSDLMELPHSVLRVVKRSPEPHGGGGFGGGFGGGGEFGGGGGFGGGRGMCCIGWAKMSLITTVQSYYKLCGDRL